MKLQFLELELSDDEKILVNFATTTFQLKGSELYINAPGFQKTIYEDAEGWYNLIIARAENL